MEKEKKNNPLLVLLIILNTIFVIFILFKQFQINKIADSSESQSTVIIDEQSPSLYKGLKARENHTFDQIEFQEMHANFQKDTGPKRFLKLSFILVIETPQSNPLGETNNMKPRIRDGIYSLINNTKSKDALRLEGRASFKVDLINRINQNLKNDKVVRVLFKTFIVK